MTAYTTWFAGRVDDRRKPDSWPINQLFGVQIAAARTILGTTKVKLGLDTNGPWTLYQNLPHARMTVFIRATRFTWFEFTRQSSGRWSSEDYLTPLFRVEFEVAEADKGPDGPVVGRTYIRETMEVTFPSNYPWSPPIFRLPSHSDLTASHEHHIYNNGVLCILANSGDWNGNTDSVASGLPVAFDWTVWQTDTFGRHGRRRHPW